MVKRRPENPWKEDEPVLQGWVPTGPRIDLMALMVMLARTQWDMNEDLNRVFKIIKCQSIIFAVCWLIIFGSSLLQIGLAYGWW